MSKVRKIMIAIPQTGPSYPREFMESYIHMVSHLMHNMKLLPFEFGLFEYFCHTFPIDANRNECFAFALKHNVDQIVFLDTDQEFGRDTLLRLLLPDRPIVAGAYYVKAEPFYPVVFKESAASTDFNMFNPIMEHPEKERYQADMIGFGCFAIKREVFEKLEMPFCKYREQPEQFKGKNFLVDLQIEFGIQNVSEDVWFWKQVKEKTDYRIEVDPQIEVLHLARQKVGKELWSYYREGVKKGVIDKHGEEYYNKLVADECQAEAIKSAS